MLLLLRYAISAVQLERKVTALKDELANIQEQERSVAAGTIQTVVCVFSYSVFFSDFEDAGSHFSVLRSETGDGRGNQKVGETF